jgi:hypothetical protein
MKRLIPLALAIVALPVAAAPEIPLQSGETRSFNLAGNAFTDAYYFDAPADARQLTFELTGSTDVDLLVRYGSPFPGTGAGATPTADYLTEGAHYRAVSAAGSERIAIGRYNVQPVRAGRWYVVAVNFASASSASTVRVTASTADPGPLPIEVVFDDATTDSTGTCSTSEWNDSTPRAAAGGNAGTTVGQQRRNAVLEAARILSNELRSPVPVRIKACWTNACDDPNTPGVDSNRCSATRATLAFAGPRNFTLRAQSQSRSGSSNFPVPLDNAPFLPRAQTIYSGTASTKLAGTTTCGFYGGDCSTSYEIRITFNNQIGQPTVLGGRDWWYGLTAQPAPATGTDFLSTALHEITHGLGFSSQVNVVAGSNPVGAKFLGYDDIYGSNVVGVATDAAGATTVTPFMALGNAGREAAMTSFTGLRWSGAEATASLDNLNRDASAPDNLVRLYAPNPIEPGSTLSHVTGTGIPAGLMLPTISGAPRRLGIAAPMLDAVGWSNEPAIAPTDNLPRSAAYFDRTRDGHGVSFGRVSGNVYYLVLYTYDASGNPEWYLAAGPVVDGVFLPAPDANGNSLLKFRFRPGQNPPSVVDPSVSGQVRLDFNQARLAPACNDGTQRDSTSPLAVMTWSLGADANRNWCLESALPASADFRATPDFSGAWGAAESGWGFDLISYRAGGGPNLLTGVLFYPDANGDGRWALFDTNAPQTTASIALKQRTGYCRTCPLPSALPADQQAGTVIFNLATPSTNLTAGNRANVDVTYRGTSGGRFTRDVPISLVTEPRAN